MFKAFTWARFIAGLGVVAGVVTSPLVAALVPAPVSAIIVAVSVFGHTIFDALHAHATPGAKMILAALAALGLAAVQPARAQITTAQAGLLVPLYNPANSPPLQGYASLGRGVPATFVVFDTTAGDSVPTRTVLLTGSAPGAGIYQLSAALVLTTAGTGGISRAIATCHNGVVTHTDTLATLADSLTGGTEADGTELCYVASADSITFHVAKTVFAGTPIYATHFRVQKK